MKSIYAMSLIALLSLPVQAGIDMLSSGLRRKVQDLVSSYQERFLDNASLCEGRLTLTTGTPITTSNVASAGTLYFTPYKGNRVSVCADSSCTRWEVMSFSEVSKALTITSGTNYDVYAYNNAGTLALELQAWSTNTARSANYTVSLQNGVYVQTGTLGVKTRRYLGTIRASGSNLTSDTETQRFVWNYCNRVKRNLFVYDSTVSWSMSALSWRYWNNSSANQFEVVVGVQEARAVLSTHVSGQSSGGYHYHGICVDCNNSISQNGGYYGLWANSSGVLFSDSYQNFFPAIGYHYFAWTETGSGDGTYQIKYGADSYFTGFIEG